MIRAIPIAQTTPDWPAFLKCAREALGRSVSRPLDAAGKRPEGVGPWIVALAEMVSPGSTMAVLRNAGPLLAHANVSLLCATDCDILWAVLESGRLHVASVERNGFRLAVISGDLESWRATVINGCSEVVSVEFREFCDQAMLALEKLGLGDMWKDYRKVNLPDHTFKLLPR